MTLVCAVQKSGRLMLMMLACAVDLGTARPADAHDAGRCCGSLEGTRRLMLMMLVDAVDLGKAPAG